MTTKTELLRRALIGRGLSPAHTASHRDCLLGTSPAGKPVYIWLDSMGGGRWATEPRVGVSRALSAQTIALILADKPSVLLRLEPK